MTDTVTESRPGEIQTFSGTGRLGGTAEPETGFHLFRHQPGRLADHRGANRHAQASKCGQAPRHPLAPRGRFDQFPTDPRGDPERRTALSVHLLIVDDHPLFRDALAATIRLAHPDAVLHEADGIEAACAVLAANRSIDLTLLDLSMRGTSGFDGLITIRANFPRIPILIVSGHEDPRIVREALQHGAAGFVPKAMDKATLTRAITEVLSGALFLPPGLAEANAPSPRSKKAPLPERLARLTPQQLRVLMMIRQGKLNKQIAHELQVGDSTVKAHVSEILRKLEVISRTQIVIDTASLDFDQIHNAHPA